MNITLGATWPLGPTFPIPALVTESDVDEGSANLLVPDIPEGRPFDFELTVTPTGGGQGEWEVSLTISGVGALVVYQGSIQVVASQGAVSRFQRAKVQWTPSSGAVVVPVGCPGAEAVNVALKRRDATGGLIIVGMRFVWWWGKVL